MSAALSNGALRTLSPTEAADLATAQAGIAPPPAPIPTMTRRQLLLALVAGGFLTTQEALDAARSGAVPAVFAAILATLPGPSADAARITWASMTMAVRTDPLFALLVSAGAATTGQIDDLFVVGANL